jgi:hypothetical protein
MFIEEIPELIFRKKGGKFYEKLIQQTLFLIIPLAAPHLKGVPH